MDRHARHYGSGVDAPHHRTEHAGTRPSLVLPREDFNRSLAQNIKNNYGDVEKGKRGYKVSSI
jgi:hypothetical protein